MVDPASQPGSQPAQPLVAITGRARSAVQAGTVHLQMRLFRTLVAAVTTAAAVVLASDAADDLSTGTAAAQSKMAAALKDAKKWQYVGLEQLITAGANLNVPLSNGLTQCLS
jgi:hypothetical protein